MLLDRWYGKGILPVRRKPPSVIVPPQSRGVYFVRVFLPSGQLLREYAMELRGRRLDAGAYLQRFGRHLTFVARPSGDPAHRAAPDKAPSPYKS